VEFLHQAIHLSGFHQGAQLEQSILAIQTASGQHHHADAHARGAVHQRHPSLHDLSSGQNIKSKSQNPETGFHIHREDRE